MSCVLLGFPACTAEEIVVVVLFVAELEKVVFFMSMLIRKVLEIRFCFRKVLAGITFLNIIF